MTPGRKAIPLVAVALAAFAAWALATFESDTASQATHEKIDDASRAELGRVLRESRDTQ